MRIPETPLGLTIVLLFYSHCKVGHQRLDKQEFLKGSFDIQNIVDNYLHNLNKVILVLAMHLSGKTRLNKVIRHK